MQSKVIGRGTFYRGDSLELMRQMKPESVDLVVSDVPYKVTKGGRSKNTRLAGWARSILKDNDGNGGFTHNNVEPEDYMRLIYRVCKPGAHVYVMMGHLQLEKLLAAARQAGFVFSNILSWDKNNCVLNQRYMKNREYVYLFYKQPAKNINRVGSKQGFPARNMPGKDRVHPTQKPISLLKHYIRNSSNPGDVVFDPFAGSGSLAIAAQQSGRRWITCEIDPIFADKAVNHIRQSCKSLAKRVRA